LSTDATTGISAERDCRLAEYAVSPISSAAAAMEETATEWRARGLVDDRSAGTLEADE
jgi:hypothetical protein